jgi:hypothetical protein
MEVKKIKMQYTCMSGAAKGIFGFFQIIYPLGNSA